MAPIVPSQDMRLCDHETILGPSGAFGGRRGPCMAQVSFCVYASTIQILLFNEFRKNPKKEASDNSSPK